MNEYSSHYAHLLMVIVNYLQQLILKTCRCNPHQILTESEDSSGPPYTEGF